MTADESMTGDTEGAFELLDPRLTIYALANGMDLSKDPSARRLEWYSDGSERGIAVEATDQGTVMITAMAWSRDDPSSVRTRTHRSDMPAQELAQTLSTELQGAMDAANAL